MDAIAPSQALAVTVSKAPKKTMPCRVLWLWISLWLGTVSFAFAGIYEEYSIKAVFIYKFTRYVEWPQRAFIEENAPLRLCVYGKNPFGKALLELQDKRVGNRTLEVRHVQQLQDIPPCHILFVGAANQPELPQILTTINNASILTIGDTHYFTQHGGIIGLRLLQGKVQVDINLHAAKAANLNISSKLLSVATIVGRGK